MDPFGFAGGAAYVTWSYNLKTTRSRKPRIPVSELFLVHINSPLDIHRKSKLKFLQSQHYTFVYGFGLHKFMIEFT